MSEQTVLMTSANLMFAFGLILSFHLKSTRTLFFVCVCSLLILGTCELVSRKYDLWIIASLPALAGSVFMGRSIPIWLIANERPDMVKIAVLWNLGGAVGLACAGLIYALSHFSH